MKSFQMILFGKPMPVKVEPSKSEKQSTEPKKARVSRKAIAVDEAPATRRRRAAVDTSDAAQAVATLVSASSDVGSSANADTSDAAQPVATQVSASSDVGSSVKADTSAMSASDTLRSELDATATPIPDVSADDGEEAEAVNGSSGVAKENDGSVQQEAATDGAVPAVGGSSAVVPREVEKEKGAITFGSNLSFSTEAPCTK